jgi:hypothetical protein
MYCVRPDLCASIVLCWTNGAGLQQLCMVATGIGTCNAQLAQATGRQLATILQRLLTCASSRQALWMCMLRWQAAFLHLHTLQDQIKCTDLSCPSVNLAPE